jgi:hypothetical protein
MMTPKDLAKSLRERVEHAAGGLPGVDQEQVAAFWRILEFQAEQIISEAYNDAADYCDETASEHNFNIYGKRELEMVARLLRLRAAGEDIGS